ncbi:MAG: hypothetical protein A3H95_16795 [Acidobacteria bacterium RIFCSPLOWO2_02_FULL_64_15]|nr:MAG: hypothetical protein A3H95_16795 [Acidobacteria bacterium RIFCSPLOWO2_02_FULL_64_15]
MLAQHPPTFAQPTSSFSKAFPEIKSVSMVVEEQDSGQVVRSYNFKEDTLPGEYLNCTNPRCYNGGYDVGQTLRFMVAGHTTHFEDHRSCQGYEGSPKGRRRDGPCDRAFKVTVDLVFIDGH